MKYQSFRRRFIITFIKILGFSLLLSLLSLFLWMVVIDYVSYPANHYENLIVDIAEELAEDYDQVLGQNYRSKMEEMLPRQGIEYQVLDIEGNMLYGSLGDRIVEDGRELVLSLNSTRSIKGNNYIRIDPILDKEGRLKGAILFKYKIKATQKTSYKTLFFLANSMVLLPFLFIILFTYIYAKKLSKDINKPVNILLKAAEKIKDKDLDFTIEYEEKNEFTKLCKAFEEMRINLKDSLLRQWQLEQDRKEYIASIAHDLKTPLTIVNSYSEALIDGNIGKDRFKDYLKAIKRNNERALTLLKDLNTLSNIDNPDFMLKPIEVDIVDFINSKEKDYSFWCEDKGIDFIVEIEDLRRENFTGKFDANGLEQVLDNCISNSIRYTQKGGLVKLKVICRDDKVEFSIIDTGKGFSNEDLKNIFNKFYKGDKARSFESGHSGLGMYIAKTIVEKHGGSISAENNSPKGAIIKFSITAK